MKQERISKSEKESEQSGQKSKRELTTCTNYLSKTKKNGAAFYIFVEDKETIVQSNK